MQLREPESRQLPARPQENAEEKPIHPRRPLLVIKHSLKLVASIIVAHPQALINRRNTFTRQCDQKEKRRQKLRDRDKVDA